MRTKRKKRFRLSTFLLIVFLVCIIVYFAYTLITTQISITQKSNELSEITATVQAQQIENEELAGIVQSDNEAAYMERIARDKLGYASPGERFFVDMSGE